MKKRILLSSILTITLCLSLIVGSTFALFTNTNQVNISITAAKVKMTASIADLELYSVKATPNGSIEDHLGGKYEYTGPLQQFTNGGTATFDEALILEKVTPGDMVKFNITGTNGSDVTIQYRYIIECVSGEALMKDFVVYVGENTTTGYSAMRSYTSAWKSLTPDQANMEAVPVTIEFPVSVANDEYQGQNVEIRVAVEAVQGNADVTGKTATVAFLNGSSTMSGDINNVVNITKEQNVSLDLDHNSINNSVYNYGTVEISDGKIEIDAVGLENYGDATLNHVEMNSGSASDYGFIAQAGSTTVLNNTSIMSGGGAVAAVNGAQVTFNSGSVEVNSTSTSGRYLFYAVGDGTEITINDGSFDFNKTQNQKRAYIYAADGATVSVKGGTFGKASTRSGYTAGILTGEGGKVVITGGTFGFDPSTWVADGYQALKNGANWMVLPEEIDTIVANSQELTDAVANGHDNLWLLDGEYDINSCGGKTLTLSGSKNAIIQVVGGAQGENNGQLDYGLDGSTVTFNGVTIKTNNQTYAGYARLSGVYNDCTFENTYCLNGNSEFNGCTFNISGDQYNIWTWGAPNATFTNCVFYSDGKAVLLYGTLNTNLTLNSCIFHDNGGLTDKKAAVEIGNDYGTSYTLTVNSTVVNGYEINDKGIVTGTTLWANKNSMSQEKLNVVVDGVDVY